MGVGSGDVYCKPRLGTWHVASHIRGIYEVRILAGSVIRGCNPQIPGSFRFPRCGFPCLTPIAIHSVRIATLRFQCPGIRPVFKASSPGKPSSPCALFASMAEVSIHIISWDMAVVVKTVVVDPILVGG